MTFAAAARQRTLHLSLFRFREFLLWDDPPEYFDDAKGFIHVRCGLADR